MRYDDKGIEANIVARGKEGHFGLQGMRERALRIEGKEIFLNGSI
jgi:signal transduction histidine kinase